VMIQIAALRSRLEKQPTDLRPYASYIRDDALDSRNRESTLPRNGLSDQLRSWNGSPEGSRRKNWF
jgi:hypothetical protein